MQVITVPNLLQPEKSFITEHDFKSVIEYLMFQYPDGFSVPHVIFFNNAKLEVIDYDKECGTNDFVTIAFSPAAPLIAVAVPYLINFAIATAISYALSVIFAPDIPSGALSSDQKSLGQQSSVYNLNSNQNVTRLGQKIPILYGRTRSYFSLIEQPYYYFKNNEMFLSQMMAVSAGDATIEELLIADTPEENLGTDDIIYKSYQEVSFTAGSIKADILSSFGDDDYHMRVKTLPEISGLEIRGTPENASFVMRFNESEISFYNYANGDTPDLSSLVLGSIIAISGTLNGQNDGEYIVETVGGLVGGKQIVTVSDHTFVTEPTDSITVNTTTLNEYREYGNKITQVSQGFFDIGLGAGSVFTITGASSSANDDFQVSSEDGNYTYIRPNTASSSYVAPNGSSTTFTYLAKQYQATFQSSYGAYTLEATPSSLDSVEIDVEYPRGIYNSDSSGNFTDREISLEYKMIGSLETNWSNLNTNPDAGWPAGTTEQAKDNTPLRRSYNLPIPDGLTDNVPLKIRLRRSSAEVADIKSQDQAIVTRVKSIYNEPDITAYGNMTILWVRAKASNAISSAGQFQINGWVSRTDVAPDLTSVITDLYTNTDYGAGLNGDDLVLPDMVEPNTVIDSATDSGVVQTATEYYSPIAINDSGFILTSTEYYYRPFSDVYRVRWNDLVVIAQDTALTINTEYSTDDFYFYIVDEAAPAFLTSYNARRYEKDYSIVWGGIIVYSSLSKLEVGAVYLGTDGYYYEIYDISVIVGQSYSIRRYKYISTEYWAEFNGAIDANMTVMDAIRMIAKAGRFNVYLDGQSVKVRRDEVQLIRTALFNETNILKDSFKLDYLFGEDDGYNGVSVKYRSPLDFKENVATFPSDSTNPQVLELIGCTDQVLALAEATYGWLQKESRRKVVSFSTDLGNGILPNYLDRIGVTHNVPEWGLSSNIVAVNGNQITINCQLFTISDDIGICSEDFGDCADTFCEIVPENIDYDTIIFRNKDGSVSDLFSFTIIDTHNILLDLAPPAWLYTGYDYDKTPFSIGVSNKFVKDYIVTEIAPMGNNVVNVKAINYDSTVYEPVPLIDGFDNILVDGDGNELF